MIDVQHDPLGALEEDPLAGAASLVEHAPHDVDKRADTFGDTGKVGQQCLAINGTGTESPAQDVVVGKQGVDP